MLYQQNKNALFWNAALTPPPTAHLQEELLRTLYEQNKDALDCFDLLAEELGAGFSASLVRCDELGLPWALAICSAAGTSVCVVAMCTWACVTLRLVRSHAACV